MGSAQRTGPGQLPSPSIPCQRSNHAGLVSWPCPAHSGGIQNGPAGKCLQCPGHSEQLENQSCLQFPILDALAGGPRKFGRSTHFHRMLTRPPILGLMDDEPIEVSPAPPQPKSCRECGAPRPANATYCEACAASRRKAQTREHVRQNRARLRIQENERVKAEAAVRRKAFIRDRLG
jgi:hypothetical protein